MPGRAEEIKGLLKAVPGVVMVHRPAEGGAVANGTFFQTEDVRHGACSSASEITGVIGPNRM